MRVTKRERKRDKDRFWQLALKIRPGNFQNSSGKFVWAKGKTGEEPAHFNILRTLAEGSRFPEPFQRTLISQKVLIKTFGKSQFTHKSDNLSFIITSTKRKLKDLCKN